MLSAAKNDSSLRFLTNVTYAMASATDGVDVILAHLRRAAVAALRTCTR
jgi:hypothetical protein